MDNGVDNGFSYGAGGYLVIVYVVEADEEITLADISQDELVCHLDSIADEAGKVLGVDEVQGLGPLEAGTTYLCWQAFFSSQNTIGVVGENLIPFLTDDFPG